MLPLDLGSANTNQAHVVRSVFLEMIFEQDSAQEGWGMILHSRLIDLAVRTLRLARRQGQKDLPVFEPGNASTERVAHYALRLKSRFYRQETLAEAARSVGLSRRQFTELFRKVTGQSWRHYILGLRLRHAARLLIETDRSVTAVAFECGFDDLSHFHHSFKSAYSSAPLAYREQRQVRVPAKARPFPEPLPVGQSQPGFKLRGIKGWFWTPEQYLEEIPVMASLKMNFLMNCYGSMFSSAPGEPWCNQWWKPMTDKRKGAYAGVIRACRSNGIVFCFTLHPHLASPRPLNPASAEDLEQFYRHYAWAQSQGVRWFCVSLDGVSWGPATPAVEAAAYARFVNTVFARLRAEDPEAQLIFCPVPYWGDGTNPEHRAYLGALAQEMHPDAYVFWTGDGVVTPRVTRVAAESYKSIVRHRLLLWDNYPVNDGNPTLHLGPVSGRDSDLCEVIDGYISNPLATQNQINRIPLATCGDYAYNPGAYDPARSIGQAIVRLAKTKAQRHALKDLVEAYPGFIIVGGGTGTNPVRGKFSGLMGATESASSAQDILSRMEDVHARLEREFPDRFLATRKTVADDIAWMKGQCVAS